MADKGWICLYRQIQECWVWTDKPFSKGQAWIDLLLLANHRPKKISIDGIPVTIERGQFHTSTVKLADRWGWDRRKVSRFLDVLEGDSMLTQRRTSNGTTISLENYEVYQDGGTADGTTKGTAHSTSKSTPDGTQTTNKQLNNETISNKARPKSIEEVIAYCQERGNKVDPQKWYDYYSSNGWKVGKNPMKDWKASVRTWEKNSYDKPKQNNKFNEFSQNSYDFDALEREITKWIAQ